jgi:copper homeostasis protein (lipoprotein)
MQGHEIESKLNYNLIRTKAFESINPSLEMDGMLKYAGNIATFTECATGQSWRVVAGGEYKALRSGYFKYQRRVGEELMASVEGQVVTRHERGEWTDRTLLVQREIGIWPGEGCSQPNVSMELQNTYWKLTRLEGAPVVLAPQQREPNLVFRTEQNRVTGSGGCNNLNGSYTLKGNEITLGRVASTMMACANSMDTEYNFLKSLETVRTWKILGQHLELYGVDGSIVARFEARQLK